MKILVVDNYDSFTYNLVHYLQGEGAEVEVCRVDAIDFDALLRYEGLVISPGPGLPSQRPELNQALRITAQHIPILGVCLGLQAIGEFFGGSLYNQHQVKHGIAASCLRTGNSRLLEGLPEKFEVGLYHSWALNREDLPGEIRVTAQTPEGVVMAIEHTEFPVFGVQFHPESIMTAYGRDILRNFLQQVNSQKSI